MTEVSTPLDNQGRPICLKPEYHKLLARLFPADEAVTRSIKRATAFSLGLGTKQHDVTWTKIRNMRSLKDCRICGRDVDVMKKVAAMLRHVVTTRVKTLSLPDASGLFVRLVEALKHQRKG